MLWFHAYHDRECIGTRPRLPNGQFADEYKWVTYGEVWEDVQSIGFGLQKLGVQHKSRLGVFARCIPEWLLMVLSSYVFGFAIASLYESLGPDALQEEVENSRPETVVVEAAYLPNLFAVIEKIPDAVKKLVIIGEISAEWTERARSAGVTLSKWGDLLLEGQNNRGVLPNVSEEDLLFVCYTSGSTGTPKGVMVTQRQFQSNQLGTLTLLGNVEFMTHYSLLPFSHVYERYASSGTLSMGGRIGFNSSGVANLLSDLEVLKPSLFCCVPRILSRVYDGAMQNLRTASPIKRGLFWAAWYAKKFCLKRGLSTWLMDKVVLDKLKAKLGGRVNMLICAGAALDPAMHDFIRVAFGCPVRQGYGSTESGVNISSPNDIFLAVPGALGGPQLQSEVKLAPLEDYDDPDAGEIWVGGEAPSEGYLGNPEATAQVWTEWNGSRWVKTGDVGK